MAVARARVGLAPAPHAALGGLAAARVADVALDRRGSGNATHDVRHLGSGTV